MLWLNAVGDKLTLVVGSVTQTDSTCSVSGPPGCASLRRREGLPDQTDCSDLALSLRWHCHFKNHQTRCTITDKGVRSAMVEKLLDQPNVAELFFPKSQLELSQNH